MKGTIHKIPDTSTANAATALTTAYSQLNARVADILLVYPAQFGQNLVLTPHTYLMNGATQLTDTLYLNALGRTDATFIIKCYGAFSALPASRVILMNGAQAKNVYWMVNGAVSILAGAIFNGTIICSSGAMDITNGAVVNGRALTTTGALNTTSATISMPPGCGPDIITDPINDTICLGDTARFIVNAVGNGMSFRWRKGNVDLVNGLRISGANKDTLLIFPTLISDTASDYSVIVSGVGPNDTSTVAALFIGTPPVVITEPINQSTCLGGKVQFVAKATGKGLVYQWRKGNVNLVNGPAVSGVNGDTLTINPTTYGDTASTYNVLVSGTCGVNDTSNFVHLSINSATVITVEPTNQTTCANGSVSFNVTAVGVGLSYKWRKGNVVLVNGLTISGATTATLTLNPSSVTDTASNYNVIVSGICGGSDTSNLVKLSIGTPPVITVEPTNHIACVGSQVSIGVTATGSALTYQWRKGNTFLANGGSISGATSATLVINPLILADSGSAYNVIVSGSCTPKDTSNFVSLTLNTPAVITTQPIGQTVCAGTAINFTVVATGSGLTYTWRKGTVALLNTATVSGVTTSTLTINPTIVADSSSFYNVIVGGTCAVNDTSNATILTVNGLPVITTQPLNQVVCIGATATLSVAATGTALTYQWRKGAVVLTNGAGISGVTTSVLTIQSAAFTDTASNYTVIVSGTCAPSDTSANVSLLISNPPVASPSSNSPICVNDMIQLTSPLITGAAYSWSGPNGFVSPLQNVTIANATVSNSGVYRLVVSIGSCASAPDSVTVLVKDCPVTGFFIPEGFSPNGDGFNDMFVIRGINQYPNNTIHIYNRWGVKVYEASPYTGTWDGTTTLGLSIGGSALPVGTYFYTLDLGDGSKVIQGSIYLNR